ncbi:NAD(P)-dependent oxidoreductase [Agarivorans sp. Toyoura001]|uniref:dTDP-4-dehydrorhamnose reductase n=1 Tax=Agarivorans sp. Toyoura001 TaxID=2283141 RepID=UPI0010D8B706|nr:dTDP-4-dehydrorhamnose reductase [Agarivorans sp. Toyoura001]GDY24136.1 NAD(P)-dependent oxidoreductase [Agarivorans sp. Toyoura001]
MKILLTGANGQLGSCLQDLAETNPQFTVIATDFQDLDITNEQAVIDFVASTQPDVIVNAAAHTAVDKAQTEVELATAINAKGPEYLAKAAKQVGIPIIHVSTDYVFDGTATTPYLPTHPAKPLGIYGETKWQGEEAVRNTLAEHIIIRTAWVFSEYGNNFVKTMLRLGGEREELGVIADQYGCPNYAGDLAAAILHCCAQIKGGNTAWGSYHHCGDLPTSWHGFTRAILAEGLAQGKLTNAATLNAIKTEDYPLPAPRPAYSVMDCSSMFDAWGVGASDWRSALSRVVATL